MEQVGTTSLNSSTWRWNQALWCRVHTEAVTTSETKQPNFLGNCNMTWRLADKTFCFPKLGFVSCCVCQNLLHIIDSPVWNTSCCRIRSGKTFFFPPVASGDTFSFEFPETRPAIKKRSFVAFATHLAENEKLFRRNIASLTYAFSQRHRE